MNNQHQTAQISWNEDGVPASVRFDDPYFSLADGLAETQHVFLGGNRLPKRFKRGFHIAELGFGTGLNLLAAMQLWQQSGQIGALHFTSFEAFPMSAVDMETALSLFPEVAELSALLFPHWAAGETSFQIGPVQVRVILGDARKTLPDWLGRADAWFLDGFSPAKNPELWSPDLMAQVAVHTNQDGTLATYTAAGHIRRSLSDVGFRIHRVPGYGRKRHMTTGILKDPNGPE